jgi:hypothetical protein
MIYIWIFMAGFLTNAIVWRVQQHAMDDIAYPVVLLVLAILAIIAQPKAKLWTLVRKPGIQQER